MLEYITTPLVSVLSSVITAIITHVLTKRRYHTEVDGSVIANMSESLDFYKSICDDNKMRLDAIITKSNAMQVEINKLQANIKSMLKLTCDTTECTKRHIISNMSHVTEDDGSVIANISESLDSYKSICDDNKMRLDAIITKSNAMQVEINKLQANIKSMLKLTCETTECTKRQTTSNI